MAQLRRNGDNQLLTLSLTFIPILDHLGNFWEISDVMSWCGLSIIVEAGPRCEQLQTCPALTAVAFSIFVLDVFFPRGGVSIRRRRRCEAGLRSSLLRQMQVLMHMLKRHMCPYLPAMLDLARHCWTVRAKSGVLHCSMDIPHLG